MDGKMRGVVLGLVAVILVSVAIFAGLSVADLMGQRQLPSRISVR